MLGRLRLRARGNTIQASRALPFVYMEPPDTNGGQVTPLYCAIRRQLQPPPHPSPMASGDPPRGA
eukprot:1840716-Pyramimonas_sp.AAC.1